MWRTATRANIHAYATCGHVDVASADVDPYASATHGDTHHTSTNGDLYPCAADTHCHTASADPDTGAGRRMLADRGVDGV